jgi:hypothetical protein
VSASYFANQITERTILDGRLNQRLFGRLCLNLSGGYQLSSYEASAIGEPVNSDNDSVYFRTRLGTRFLKRANASIFYNWRRSTSQGSTSQDQQFDYDTQQLGFEIGYNF